MLQQTSAGLTFVLKFKIELTLHWLVTDGQHVESSSFYTHQVVQVPAVAEALVAAVCRKHGRQQNAAEHDSSGSVKWL
jgi:hypothetical protein